MTEVDLNLIREIIRQLYRPMNAEATLMDESYALSPPSIDGYENQSDVILDHIDLLANCDFIERTRRIRMRNHPDPVTIEPTPRLKDWAYKAFNDKDWSDASADLRQILRDCQPRHEKTV